MLARPDSARQVDPMSFPDAEERRQAGLAWRPPAGTATITTVEAHAEGEPLRVVLAGVPEPVGGTASARRVTALTSLDAYRRALMWEPRGHADMYGCLVLPPATPDAAASVLFLHNEGWSTMCGHGVLAVSRVLLETAIVPRRAPETRFILDTPAGPVRVAAEIKEDGIGAIRFRNVPSWVQALDATVVVPGLGPVPFDLAFGGAYYAFVDAASIGLELRSDRVAPLIEAAARIKASAATAAPPLHPTDSSLSFLYGVIFTGPAQGAGRHSRHVCVFADGEVDRSPTGTGVSARAAILYARGELELDHEIVIESIIGSRFSVRLVERVAGAGGIAVVPEVGGRVAITGRCEWFIEPGDPFADGFLLR
jgi:trans-L-3-hydroxyproline dehydratase